MRRIPSHGVPDLRESWKRIVCISNQKQKRKRLVEDFRNCVNDEGVDGGRLRISIKTLEASSIHLVFCEEFIY